MYIFVSDLQRKWFSEAVGKLHLASDHRGFAGGKTVPRWEKMLPKMVPHCKKCSQMVKTAGVYAGF
jgi:hypothetical protein